MKQEPENEMDLLLRNLGRLKDTSRPEGEEADTHLDPDELNAYAEKALPAAAHARYTEHLADCSRCRDLVSQLSLAAGAVIEEKAPSVVPKTSGLKAFLSSLFSPMVMRYAVPAMVLIIVGSVGFLVFRQSNSVRFATSKSNESVAQTQEQPGSKGYFDSQTTSKEQANRTPTAVVAQNKVGETKQGVAPEQPEAPKEQRTAPADDSRRGAKDAKSDQPVTSTDQIAGTPDREAGKVDVAAASPKPTVTTAQNEPIRKTIQAPPAPAETVTVVNEKEAKAPAKGADTTVGGFAAGRAGGAKAKSETANRAQAQAQAEGRDEEAKKRERQDKDEPDTKTVAGRRFRKEGSVWTDVAYRSQATTNVTRGSEQYRALVADEPGIKTIADQLDGEVIVVWKGRAYKIR